MSLLRAVLDRAVAGWRGITYTPADVRLLQPIRRDLGLARRKESTRNDGPGGVAAAA